MTLREFIDTYEDSGSYNVLADDSGKYIWIGLVSQIASETPLLLDFDLRAFDLKNKQIVLWETYNELLAIFDE